MEKSTFNNGTLPPTYVHIHNMFVGKFRIFSLATFVATLWKETVAIHY